jgi:hypothetical protein
VVLDGPISPMLATPGRALPDGDGWALEPNGMAGARSRT